MTAITVSRQLGSQGSEIAQVVAAQLGYKIVWREIINEAARRACTPEVALATIDELNLLGLRPKPEALQAYHRAVFQVMEELANKGNTVIIGRAGQVVLKGRPDVYHIRIIAPFQLRADRLAARKNLDPNAAMEQIKASDRSRKQYLRRFYQTDWNDPLLYDLVINTQRLSVAYCANLICDLVSNNPLPSQP